MIAAAALLLAAAVSPHVRGEVVRLTRDGRLKRDALVVRGGTHVVYTVVESPTIVRIARLDLSTGQSESLYPQAATSQFESSFTPDERYHAFVEFRGVTNVKLVIRDRLENRDALFDPGSDRAHLGNPVLDPHARRVIFSLPRTVGQQLVSINFEAGDLRYLTAVSESIDDWAAVSPDGRQIAFGSSREGDFEIYVMPADGGEPRRLTVSPGIDMRPSWRADGRQLAFTSMRDGNYEIYVMAADGSNVRRVTTHAERDDFARWHPDGRRLVVISERDGESDLYLVDVP
jgi:Tol biopolymer transport system component